jgi:hypothetical protein
MENILLILAAVCFGYAFVAEKNLVAAGLFFWMAATAL